MAISRLLSAIFSEAQHEGLEIVLKQADMPVGVSPSIDHLCNIVAEGCKAHANELQEVVASGEKPGIRLLIGELDKVDQDAVLSIAGDLRKELMGSFYVPRITSLWLKKLGEKPTVSNRRRFF